MGKLFTGAVILAAATAVAAAAPVWATPTDAPSPQQVFLQETQQVTGRAHLIFKGGDGNAAVEGKAELVEYSQGLVVYEPSAAPGKPADLKARPASAVHTTTTATVSWAPAKALPTPLSF